MADSEVYLSIALIIVHAYYEPELEKSVIIIRSPSEKCRCKAKTLTIRTRPIIIYFAKNKEISATTLSLPTLTDFYPCFALLFRTLTAYYFIPCESNCITICIAGHTIIISTTLSNFVDEINK